MIQQGGPAECVAHKRAVVFDLFHTLTAIEVTSARSLPSTAEILGIEKPVWDKLVLEGPVDRSRGGVTDPFEIVARLARTVRPDIGDNVVNRAVQNRVARFEAAILEMPDTSIQVLRSLRALGKRVGLISNADAMEVQAWDRSPAAGLFDVAVFSCRVGYVKPEPEIYRICTSRLGVEPGECVYVGDGASRELARARQLGFVTIMTTAIVQRLWPERVSACIKDADYVIRDLTELVE